MKLAVFRDKTDIQFTIQLELNGGTCDVSELTVVCGGKYTLPSAMKPGHILAGFYTDEDFTNKVTNDTKVDYNIRTLYAKWVYMTNYTSFEVTTTSAYKTFGLYSATKKSSSENITIDWGDGIVEQVDSISQKYHDYSSVGTFTVKVSDDITSLTVSNSSSTYYNKIRYTLKKVLTYSTSITTIPSYCYQYASSLTTINADFSNITSLNSQAFYYCNALTSFQFMRKMTKITSIPNYCFYYCTYFTDLNVIPTSVTSFGVYAFYQCRITDLSRIRSTDTLNSYCFAYNTTLTSLTTLKTRTSFPTYLFNYCTGLTQADLESFTSLTSLNTGCFQYCSQLTSVTLPSTIKMVSDYAFQGCSQLKNTDFIADKPQLTSIGNYSFAQCTTLTSINLPDSVKSIGSYAFYYDYASNFKEANLCGLTALTSIGNYTFQYCYNLTSMSLPSSLTSIGDYAFAGCYNISQISSYRDTAPTTYSYTFGYSTSNGTTAYVGNNKKSLNQSYLYVNIPNNYKTGYWQSSLLDSSKCNFQLKCMDEKSAYGFQITGLENKYIYQDQAIVPTFQILDYNGNQLVEGTDYTYEITDNIEVGTATITVTGIGEYKDTTQFNFIIYDPFVSELVEIDLNNQWREVTYFTNTNSDYVVYESYSNYYVSNGYAKMYIRTSGVRELTIYLNSYGESSYDYSLAFNPDVDVTSLPSTATSGVKSNTSGFQKAPSSTNIGNTSYWRKIDYSLDGGDHFILICYRKDGSVNNSADRGFLAIPKEYMSGGRIFVTDSQGSHYINKPDEVDVVDNRYIPVTSTSMTETDGYYYANFTQDSSI